MVDTPTLRQLAFAAEAMNDAYMNNSDETMEKGLLEALEDAEETLSEHARYAQAVVHLFTMLDDVLAVVDRAAGEPHKGRSYAAGRVKRETARELASEIRKLLATTEPTRAAKAFSEEASSAAQGQG